MWASCWHGGFRIVDISDLSKPKTAASYNYHPPFPEPTHTVMPVPNKIGDKRIAIAIDEEDQAQSANEEEARRGRMHADRKSTRLNSSHTVISYAVFCLKKKKKNPRAYLLKSKKKKKTYKNTK